MTSRKVDRFVISMEHAEVEKILKCFGVPPDKFELGHNRLAAMVAHVRLMEHDFALGGSYDFFGKPAQAQRADFSRAADYLDKVATKIGEIDRPRQRLLADRVSGLYVRPTGAAEFRHAMGESLAEVLDPRFISNFGVRPIQWRETDETKRALNIANKSAGVSVEAVRITTEVLQRVAKGLRRAEAELKAHTPKGGPRRSLIREFVLLNLVGLWHDLFESKRGVYFDDAHPELKEFCESLCRCLGVKSFSSERHIRHATRSFNARFRTKPDPEMT
jgi:hypothetical protein